MGQSEEIMAVEADGEKEMSLSFTDYRAIVDRCSFPNFSFIIGSGRSGDDYLQIECSAYDNITAAPLNWRGRKWRLSPHMTPSEVVQTAFKAVLTAIEHETRETFLYRGVAIFDPHYDVEKLVELRSRPDSISARSEA